MRTRSDRLECAQNMMPQTLLVTGAVALMVLAACAPKSTTPNTGKEATASEGATFADAATSAEIHEAMLNPGSDSLYAVEADPPMSAEGWAAAEAAAGKVIDGAVELQAGVPPAGQLDWIRISKAVEDAARRAAVAARNKNVEALALANGDFTAQCEDCHNAFRDIDGGGMMSEPGQ